MPVRSDIVKRLRELYDQGGVDQSRDEFSKLLHELSKFYQHDNDKWSFVCRSALLNGALAGTENDSLKASIVSDITRLGEELCRAKNGCTASAFDLVEFSTAMKKQIDERRTAMSVKLRNIKMIANDVSTDQALLNLERDVINDVRTLMKDTSNSYAEIMRQISDKCIQVLGEPPCQFSHFAMGSLARQEVTLYSDFENAIILGDGVNWTDAKSREETIEYFRWYATLFDLVLINFGETPISLVGIDGLNDHYSGDKSKNWFRDTFITCGIMFDSCLPYASKNPFGRKPTFDKPEGTELILPSDEMLQYLTENKSLKEGYHLSNMLLESRHVAGNERLFRKFRSECTEMANVLRHSAPYMQRDLEYTRENLKKFNLTPKINTSGWAQHAKKSFYRPMSVHIPFISRLCGVVGFPSTSHIVEKLNEEAGLSDEVTHNLLYAIAIANVVRMKLYSERTKQSDGLAGSVHLMEDTSRISSIFDAVGDRSALDYYEISLGMRNAIIEIVDSTADRVAGLTPDHAAKTVIKCFEIHLRKRGDMKIHGDIHIRFLNYDKACENYEAALAVLRKGGNARSTSDKTQECEVLMSLGLASLHALRFFDSIDWYKQLISLERALDRGNASLTNIATALTMSGQCYTEQPTIRDGFNGCIREAEDIWRTLLSSEPNNRDYLKGLAELRDTEGFYFLRVLDYESSLAKYRESLKLFEECFLREGANNDTVKVKNGIAMCLMRLERYQEALEVFDEVINFKQAVIGDNVADLSVSWYLRHKAICLSHLGRHEDSVRSFHDSIKVRMRAPGSKYDVYSALANTYRFLAQCCLRTGHYEEAIEASQEVLKLVENIPGTVKGKEFTEIAEGIIRTSNKKLAECSVTF